MPASVGVLILFPILLLLSPTVTETAAQLALALPVLGLIIVLLKGLFLLLPVPDLCLRPAFATTMEKVLLLLVHV